jgi:hypothetical protein
MKKFELEIFNDESPESPREWDNITTMICFHKRYNVGDKTDYKSSDFDSWDELKEQIESDNKVLMIKPLYMYDHSGITISTSSFNDRWDSGQIGWVFITEKQYNYICGKDVEYTDEKLECIINSEVHNYDQYLTGEVYGYTIYEIETCSLGHEHRNVVESCGGYYDEGDCRDEGMNLLSIYEKEKEVV